MALIKSLMKAKRCNLQRYCNLLFGRDLDGFCGEERLRAGRIWKTILV